LLLARNQEKAQKVLPAGIEIRPGSYEDEKQLVESLKGVDKLLFISSQPGGKTPRLEQHKNVLQAVKEAGVKYVAYTSFPHADTATSPLSKDHQETEKLIKELGIDYSFVRNNWYLENELSYIEAGKDNKPFVYAAGNGKAGWALEREYAEGAAKVLIASQPKKIYEFAGTMYTYEDLAKAISEVTGNKIQTQSLSIDDYKKMLEGAGMDDGTVQVVAMIQKLIYDGELDEETTDLPEVLGHELKTLVEAVKEVLSK
jgi:Predicted nucleoside-diphosphate-sugar epimerases